MDTWESFIKNVVEHMGLRDYHLEINLEDGRGSLFVYENNLFIRENLPSIVESMNHIIQMVAKKNQAKTFFLDINNYRRDRENIIAELARAAAKRVSATKEQVSLPAMNSYERRLVHVELAIHPDVTTESTGAGKERYVIIKPIDVSKKTASE
jgi:predicted RNA-binding protein Jag